MEHDKEKLERILITNDEVDRPVASDESDRLPDPYMSPPRITPGSTAMYVKIFVAALAVAAAATAAKHYIVDQAEKPQTARYLPRD